MSRRQCGICDGDEARRKVIDGFIADGLSAAAVEREVKAKGLTVKRETVTKHRDGCLGSGGERTPEETQMAAKASASGSTEDFAALVKAEATRRLLAGEIKPSMQDGLQAQALLDRRAEKQKDRELAVTIGRLLAGGAGVGNEIAGPPIIEGTFSEVPEPVLIGSGEDASL